MVPTDPGIYPGLPMADYLKIEALSKEPVGTLLEECPASGWWASYLNPGRPREVTGEMDIGSAAHSVLLENSWACVVEIDPADHPAKTKPFKIPRGWSNDSIKAARDEVREAGKYPVLKGGTMVIRDMVDAARKFIDSLQDNEPAIWAAFQPSGGRSEVTMVWDDAGVLCKLRLDRIDNLWQVAVDYKTSGMSVEPNRFCRSQMYGDMGYAFGAAWYRRGIFALTGSLPDYLWLAQETAPPHLCSIMGLTPEALELATEKVAAGLSSWRKCAKERKWPGYPARVCYPEMPVYERMKWDGRLAVTKDGIDYGSQA